MTMTQAVDTAGRNPSERVDHLLDKLDVDNDDGIRADLIDELIGLGDRFPEVADRIRSGGVPA